MEGIFLFRDSGFNLYIELYYKMIKAGIIDPTKVASSFRKNAALIANKLLTTECVIADRPKKDEANGSHGVPDMGAMGGY